LAGGGKGFDEPPQTQKLGEMKHTLSSKTLSFLVISKAATSHSAQFAFQAVSWVE
jgi:uncharacterized membrane protein